MVRHQRTAPLALLLVAVDAHVSMIYKDGQIGAIRNANGATGNGRASVNSPCGGSTTFGSNGVGTVQDGATVKLTMRYAAGHNGAFRMSFACGGGDGSELEPEAAAIPPASCTVTGAGGQYGAGAKGGATAIGQEEMDFECALPLQNNAAPTDCIVGILDQRDWGGCVDVNLVPAAAALPPSPPPTPFVSSVGTYAFKEALKVDTAAGAKPSGTFTCCALAEGGLAIPQYIEGQASLQVAFAANSRAVNCPVSVPNGPPFALAPPANTATYELAATDVFTMTVSAGGNKYEGIGYIANQKFEWVVAQGLLSWTNTYEGRLGTTDEQPIVCDGTSELGLALADGAGGTVASGASGGGGLGGGSVVLIALVVLVALGLLGFFCMRRKKTPPPPPPTYQTAAPGAGGAPPPPPPPPTGGGLPPGWQELTDPASGSKYYYNAGTNQTTWTMPRGDHV